MLSDQVFKDYIIRELPAIDSTNNFTEKLLEEFTLPEGSLIYTRNQTRGIGQGQNLWESEPDKNITATVLLNPTFLDASFQFYLTIAVSLSVCDTVDFCFGKPISLIKWPNDIYCDNRKIAGILIKNYIMGNTISTSIVGLGLNINQTIFTAPIATSLKNLSGNDYEVENVMTEWHNRLAHYYSLLKFDKVLLKKLYLSRMYLINQPVDYIINNVVVTATINGIDPHGQLLLTDQAGTNYACGLKEIVFPFIWK